MMKVSDQDHSEDNKINLANNQDTAEKLFRSFVITHKKTYKDNNEYMKRLKIFTENLFSNMQVGSCSVDDLHDLFDYTPAQMESYMRKYLCSKNKNFKCSF